MGSSIPIGCFGSVYSYTYIYLLLFYLYAWYLYASDIYLIFYMYMSLYVYVSIRIYILFSCVYILYVSISICINIVFSLRLKMLNEYQNVLHHDYSMLILLLSCPLLKYVFVSSYRYRYPHTQMLRYEDTYPYINMNIDIILFG